MRFWTGSAICAFIKTSRQSITGDVGGAVAQSFCWFICSQRIFYLPLYGVVNYKLKDMIMILKTLASTFYN